jgi:hypothetical protein
MNRIATVVPALALLLTTAPTARAYHLAPAHVSHSHSSYHSSHYHYSHGVHYRNYGGGYWSGGGEDEEETVRYVPTTPNYVQSDGAGYWNQDKYTGSNPVNQVYH